MFNFAPNYKQVRHFMNDINMIRALEDDVIFVNDLRDVKNLSKIRAPYNTIVFCRGGRIVIEIGGNQQVKVIPGQLLLIPAGKLVQPMLVSTDVEAGALLVSERMLKTALGRQVTIWNRAMYMKEIYVVENAQWLDGLESYTNSIFLKREEKPFLFREIVESFFRTMLLLICEELIHHDKMSDNGENASSHDKEIFNHFLQLLSTQEQKRQRVSLYADKLNITSKYLSSICKRVSGKSPIRWITECVMQDCYRLLLDTDLSIKEISNRLGFPNPSFFGQYFREQSGETPMEFRAKRKKVV